MNVPHHIEPAHHLTHLIYIPCITQVGGALQQPMHGEQIKDSDNLKQVLNSCGDKISQELFNGATDQ